MSISLRPHHPHLTAWLEQKVGHRLPDNTICHGVMNGLDLVAVVAFSNFTGIEIELSAAAIPRSRWLNRAVFKAMRDYVFRITGARRVIARTDSTNQPARTALERIGFAHEGTLRSAARDGGDRELYSLLVTDHVLRRT